MVADIAKLSVGREEYYTRELATDHEQYLSGHGESPGSWYGAGAITLGLAGEASVAGSRPCSKGRDPTTGELLGRPHGRNAVPASTWSCGRPTHRRHRPAAGRHRRRPADGGSPSAGHGRPGGSAQARWRRLRAAEWAAWTRTLPWRVAAILGIGVSGGVLGRMLVPRLGLILGTLAAVAAGWGLRFRPSPDASAWRRGAAGERRTARLLGQLGRQGWTVLHDLAIPGSQANLDHLVIGPGGVFVIDSKQYRGRLHLDPSGRLWHGRYPLTLTLRAVEFEADQAARVLADSQVVVPIVAIHGAQVPWGKAVVDGVPVVPARRLPSMLRALPAVLGPERVADLANRARVASTPPNPTRGRLP